MWSGDDAAVVNIGSERMLISTDILVEGVDFDLAYASGEDVGWKTMAANLSDLAAMGGRGGHAVATLALPDSTPIGTVDAILEGLLRCARRWEVELVGGDLSSASQLLLGVTVTGAADPFVLRSGARPGDAICVTGALGGARAGLALLQRGADGFDELKKRQLHPRPRVEEGVALADAGATAMIDLSDGLATDLGHLVQASDVGCEVELREVPVDEDIAAAGLDEAPEDTAVIGGEDYELLCTLPGETTDLVISRLAQIGTRLTRIGTITESGAAIDGRNLQEWTSRSWEHLR